MAGGAFSNPQVATLLNEHFVCIKVDREERPDVDRHFMNWVQATQGQNGWPLSVWLTPQGRPFFGCTYLTSEQMEQICNIIAREWTDQREAVEEEAERGQTLISRVASLLHNDQRDVDYREAPEALFRSLCAKFDSRNGGFGGAPKFPTVVNSMFLVDFWRVTGNQQALDMALHTATRIIQSGIHDHLEGGFHRYSVDAEWRTPHFEKMLYDQAQLLELFATLLPLTPAKADLSLGIRSIVRYVAQHLTAPNGAFYCAEDADSSLTHSADDGDGHAAKEEGAFAVWTVKELQDLFPASTDLDLVTMAFGVKPEGNAHELPGRNVLNRFCPMETLESHFEDAQKRLNGAVELMQRTRAARPRPHRDEKILTAWNGLMISGLARASAVDADNAADYLARAEKAFASMVAGGGTAITRTGDCQPCADDLAFLIKAGLDLYEAGFKQHHLDSSIALQHELDRLFTSETGAYFYNLPDPEGIILRAPDDYDGAEPSANSVAAGNLLRLSLITGNEEYEERLRCLLAAFGTRLVKMPTARPTLLQTVLLWRRSPADSHGPLVIALPDSPAFRAVLQRHPRLTVVLRRGEQAGAVVCRHKTCFAPCPTPESLESLLSKIANN